MKKNTNLTILVLSCDTYSDLWSPFFTQFGKHWKDCAYPVVLGSNTKIYEKTNVKTILSGPDSDWSSSLLKLLEQIKTPYVFIWLDDIFPISRVNTKAFAQVIEFLDAQNGNHMHTGASFGEIEKGAPYRATALGFWRVEYLQKLLLPGETPWAFEIMGSYRTSYTDGFYCTREKLFDRLHVVEKGKIFIDAYAYCQAHNIPLDLRRRKVVVGTAGLRSWIQRLYFNTVIRIPWKLRRNIMNFLRKLLISY